MPFQNQLDPLSGLLGGALVYAILFIRRDFIPYYFSSLSDKKENVDNWYSEVAHVSRRTFDIWNIRSFSDKGDQYLDIENETIQELKEYTDKLSQLQQSPKYADEATVDAVSQMYGKCNGILSSSALMGNDHDFMIPIPREENDGFGRFVDDVDELMKLSKETKNTVNSLESLSILKIVQRDILFFIRSIKQ